MGSSPRMLGRRLRVERLEERAVLSAMAPLVDVENILAAPQIKPLAVTSAPTGMSPATVRAAYGFNQVSYLGGSVAADGTGTTIAIINAYDHPNIENDLRVFDQAMGLPAPPRFKKVNQYGGSAMPATDADWAEEIALDVEWAHAIAPGASILLVEAASNSLSDLLTAVDYARHQPGVSVVSMSWGATEYSTEAAFDSYFTTPAGHTPIAFVASSGDDGSPGLWPSLSTNVLSVGGTTLKTASSGRITSETGWSGSGGGYSRFIREPAYQTAVQTTGFRSAPDVAYNGNPTTGFSVYTSVPLNGQSGWFQVGGTSAGAPQWAALVAIADQGRNLAGKAAISNVPALVYSLSASAFNDVTTGDNGYRAASGYDLVTGLGSPKAQQVIAALVGDANVVKLASSGPATPASPAAPGNLAATPAATQVTLSWTQTATVDHFDIFRFNGVQYAKIATVSATTRGYRDLGLAGNQFYQYAVRAVNAAGAYADSFVNVMLYAAAAPTAPSALAAVAISANSVALGWSQTSAVDHYDVFRFDGQQYVVVATLPASARAFGDGGLSPATYYYYAVRAVGADGQYADSFINAQTAAAATASWARAATSAVTSGSTALAGWWHLRALDESFEAESAWLWRA